MHNIDLTLNNIKLYIVSFFVVLFSISGYSNTSEPKEELSFIFNHLIAISEVKITPDEVALYNRNYLDLINNFKKKQRNSNSEYRLLYHVFYKTHQAYLKKYKPVESFGRMLKTGEYGCLTGTALYALILNDLGYSFEVIETNYHVYLLINGAKQQYLFESTDPVYGFYSNQKDIDYKLSKKRQNKMTSSDHFQFDFELKNSIIRYPNIEEMTINLIEEYDITEKTIISSFNHWSLALIKSINKKIKTGLLYTAELYNPGGYAKLCNADAVHPYYLGVQPEIIENCRQHNVMVNAWTVNNNSDISNMCKAGVDGIITDYPSRAFNCINDFFE